MKISHRTRLKGLVSLIIRFFVLGFVVVEWVKADQVTFGESSYYQPPFSPVSEGSDIVKLPVLRYGTLQGRVSVGYRLFSGTALPGQDYLDEPGTLVFEEGETFKEISIRIVNDRVREEARETFQVRLSSLQLGLSIFPRGTFQVTIEDDDVGPHFDLGSRMITVSEAAGSVDVTIVRGETPAMGRVEVGYRTVGRTAKAGVDYLTTEGILVFGDQEYTK